MEKQRGGDHDELIEEFEYLTTDPDGILRVLEGILGQFEAKRLLSVLFQVYVNQSDIILWIWTTLQCLSMICHVVRPDNYFLLLYSVHMISAGTELFALCVKV